MIFLITRIFGILTTFLIFQTKLSDCLYIYLGTAHNILALYYGRFAIASYIRAEPKLFHWGILGGLLGITGLVIATGTPPIIYSFGIHFLLTELYTVRNDVRSGMAKLNAPGLTCARGLTYLASYVLLCNLYPNVLDEFTLRCLFVGSWIPFLYALRQSWGSLSEKQRWLLLAHEALGGLIVFIMPIGKSHFSAILTYHFMSWVIYPLIDGVQRRPNFRPHYLSVTVCLSFLIALIFPNRLQAQFIFFACGHLHNISTLIFSRLNPLWLQRLLRVPGPRPLPSA
jgi:uncharacterized membrane protein HdeD (DUF308 family)